MRVGAVHKRDAAGTRQYNDVTASVRIGFGNKEPPTRGKYHHRAQKSFGWGGISPLKPRLVALPRCVELQLFSTAATLCLEPCPNLTSLLTASIGSKVSSNTPYIQILSSARSRMALSVRACH
jgi:hypothetical protein